MSRIMSGLWTTKLTRIISALFLVLMAVLTLAFGACASATAVPTSTQVPTSAAEAAPAPFQVVGLSINPTQGYPGQEVVVTAKVKNKGNAEGEYIGELKINNFLEEQKKMTLPAGKTETLNFSTFRYEVGTYAVTLGGLTGHFEVLDTAPQAQSVSVPGAPSCCQPSASGATQPSCCGASGPITTIEPTARPSCCGG